ncbi:MAG: signal peptidase II [Candidatus Aminicenantales bacterium]
MRRHTPYFILIAVLVAVDQITKALVAGSVPKYGTMPVIPGFFDISHVPNTGAIFGMFSGSSNKLATILLTAAQIAAMVMVIYYFFKTPASQKGTKFALTLILSGAFGNLIDRVMHGYVIDFLRFYIKRYEWPNFNVADSCISIGAVLLIFFLITRRS